MQSVTLGCAQAGCPLVGGETAQMPDMYISGDFDLAGFCVGAVSRKKLLPSRCFSGDVVLALPSSGIHSNGFSLVRKLIDRCHLSLEEPAPFHSLQPSMGKALLTPTRIYSKATDILFASEGVRAIAHITGAE
jgi:phosphoribosylaminoimidazole synthetase